MQKAQKQTLRALSKYNRYSYGYRERVVNVKLTEAERELVGQLCKRWGVNISDLFRGLLVLAAEKGGIE